MGLFDKISKLIYEEEENVNSESTTPSSTSSKKGSWTDIFFENSSTEKDDTKKNRSFSDLFFEYASTEKSDKKKNRSFSDLFFEETSNDNIKSTFVEEDEKTSVLNDISSKIEHRESELINLAAFLKAVDPTDYPDSNSEYQAYLSLVKQLKEIKELAASNKSSSIASMSNYQLDANFRKFELDYQAHINSIQSLCYLSEIATLNTEMKELFSSNFTDKTEQKIAQTDECINLISQKINNFDKKYSERLYKALIEAEYRLTLLKLMVELKNGRAPRKNPFESFSSQKKRIFETYISKDIRDTNAKYNAIADGREKYTEYNLVKEELFDKLDADAEIISERINHYTLDDFLLTELFDNGNGFETLKRFLKFKVDLNFIDSKTSEAEARFLDDNYRRAKFGHNSTSEKGYSSTNNYSNRSGKGFPDYERDL